MTRDRFDSLQSRLHFSDNEDPRADTDRLWKLRPVLDILDTTFKTVYIPDRKIVVDESLWAFRGRHHAIQFNPTKRARFGMKVYRLCESDGAGAGYTSAFNVYMGQDRGDVPASMKAVTDLMNRACFFEKGYELYLDNWYSSPELFHYLSSRKTNNSAEPQVHAEGPQVRTKPQAVVDYNVGKKGVDLADQLAASYSTTRRTNKWYQNVFYHLLDMAVVNAFVVHRALGGTLTQLEFRLEIIANFLDQPPAYGRRGGLRTPPAATPSPPRRRNAPRQQQRQQVPQGHVLAFNPGRKYRRCRHCRVSRNVRKETRYRCGRCDVSLCPADCFNLWHSPL
nr:piggyBac transposable element-derived protein 4-like [Penaeus vannamei]